jgi:hypothetical protein
MATTISQPHGLRFDEHYSVEQAANRKAIVASADTDHQTPLMAALLAAPASVIA